MKKFLLLISITFISCSTTENVPTETVNKTEEIQTPIEDSVTESTTSTLIENLKANLNLTEYEDFEGSKIELISLSKNKITDIENIKERNLTLVGIQSENFIYRLDYEKFELVKFLKFTDSIDTSLSPEAGMVKILVLENKFLLIAYTNSSLEILVKQYDLDSLGEEGNIIYKETMIQNVHPCLDMVYDKSTNQIYFCRGDSSMQLNENSQQIHLPDGKIHRFLFSKDDGFVSNGLIDNQLSYLNVFPNTSPVGIESIFAIGVRNPYELHLSDDNLLYIPDVGGQNIEELNIINLETEIGSLINYGWPFYNGTDKTDNEKILKDFIISEDSINDFLNNHFVHSLPFLQYDHTTLTERGRRCAIIGGSTYFGDKSNAWKNKYFFGDYCTGEVFALFGEYPSFKILRLIQLDENITYIGNDIKGEILIGTENNGNDEEEKGKIYRLTLP